jgi:hypothetical protein
MNSLAKNGSDYSIFLHLMEWDFSEGYKTL